MTLTEIAAQSKDETFITKLEMALLQVVEDRYLQAVPPALSDPSIEGQRDRLARQVLAEPHGWAVRFARLAAVKLAAGVKLVEVTDEAIVATVAGLYDRFLPQL